MFCVYKFTHIYFTSIEKQVLKTYANLSLFCFLGTTPVLVPNLWANKEIPKLTPAPGNQTLDLKIARPMLYLTTTGITCDYIRTESILEKRRKCLLPAFFLFPK